MGRPVRSEDAVPQLSGVFSVLNIPHPGGPSTPATGTGITAYVGGGDPFHRSAGVCAIASMTVGSRERAIAGDPNATIWIVRAIPAARSRSPRSELRTAGVSADRRRERCIGYVPLPHAFF